MTKHSKAYWIKRQQALGIEPIFQPSVNASKALPDDWGEIRLAVIARDKHCIDCGDAGHGVHHLDRNRLINSLDNLIYLCWPCHRKRHHKSSCQG